MTKHRYVIRRSKPGMGNGLFASMSLSRGEFVAEYTGKRISTSLADILSTRYLFELDKKWTVDGSPRTNIARYINHCCEPNVEARIEKGSDGEKHINIYTLRSVRKGEEFIIDYGDEY